jgi:phage-related protein
VTARPQYIITTSATSFTLTVTGSGTPAENSITVTGIDSGTRYIVDSDIMEVSKRSNGMIYTRKSEGEFPVMAVGANTITGSGWSKIEIDKRERFL